MRDESPRRTFAVLFAVALAARLATLAFIDPSRDGIGDEPEYLGLARALAAGDGFVLDGARSFRPPLLPALLAPLASGGWAALRVANLFVGSLCPPLLHAALRRSPLGRDAFWPALALAVWPPAVYLSAQLLAEPLAMALVLASIAALPHDGDRGARRPFVAGLLAGLAVLARPASLFACAIVGISMRGLRATTWFALAAALVVLPWVARNAAIHGRPLLTTNSGVTLVGGNSAAALRAEWPGKWAHPDDVYAGAADAPDLSLHGWSALGEEASDARFAADARAWIRENPVAWLRLCAHKLLRLFDPDQHSGKSDAGSKSVVGWISFLPVLLLAIPGAAIAARDLRAWGPWFALVAGTVATTVVFYGDVRMRSPMDPALLAFATLAVVRFLRRRDPGR